MNDTLNREFLKTVLPSMLAFMFSGIYAIVDGFFVGRNIGDGGLAAINIAYPLVAFIQAAGTGIGMGGAVKISLAMGKKNEREQSGYLTGTLVLLLAACVIVTVLLSICALPVLKLFGAKGDILVLAEEYMKIIITGSVFQVFSVGLLPIIRNYRGSMAAMGAMIAGFATNVILDWYFVSVQKSGMRGAALATILGQAVTLTAALGFFAAKKIFSSVDLKHVKVKELLSVLIIGISPFGLTMSPNLVIMVLNRGASTYGGNEAVACYAVVSYMVCVVQLLLQGIGDGSQPLLGRFYGAGEQEKVESVRRLSFLYAGITAAVFMALLYSVRRIIPAWFGASDQTVGDVAGVLPFFLLGFVFVAFLRVVISYFYVVEKNRYAYLLIYGEPVLLAIFVLAVMPRFFGISGVWSSVPLTQAILACAGLIFLKKKNSNCSIH